MVFRIVSELPGRLRLRCGARLFTDEEARGVSYALMATGGVRTAEVHAANGSILLTFEPACREDVLAAVRALDPLRLPSVAEPGLGTREGALEICLENNRFQVEVTRLVLWRAAKRVLLPMPVRAALTCVRAVGFVAEGLRHLLAGEVTVEVLDATAIATSIARGSFAEAGTIAFLLELSSLMEEHVQSRAHLAAARGHGGSCGERLGSHGRPGRARAHRGRHPRHGAPPGCGQRTSGGRHRGGGRRRD